MQSSPKCFPGALYHYTTIENLALIISNKTIRFNRLDRVEDVDEAVTLDYPQANTLVFASCWNSDPEENVALWKLYTGLRGVRIEFPTIMFKNKSVNFSYKDDLENKINLDWDNIYSKSLMIERNMQGLNISGNPIAKAFVSDGFVYGPSFVRYFSERTALRINVFDESTKTYSVGDLGLRKRNIWSFEQEVRFRIIAINPARANAEEEGKWQWAENSPIKNGEPPLFLNRPESYCKYPIVTEFIDVPLCNHALQKISITMAPRTEESHRIIVENICNQNLSYVPPIKNSEIKLRQRQK